jgi:hypothetical protein
MIEAQTFDKIIDYNLFLLIVKCIIKDIVRFS